MFGSTKSHPKEKQSVAGRICCFTYNWTLTKTNCHPKENWVTSVELVVLQMVGMIDIGKLLI